MEMVDDNNEMELLRERADHWEIMYRDELLCSKKEESRLKNALLALTLIAVCGDDESKKIAKSAIKDIGKQT